MRVGVSVFGRFHAFNLAHELQKRDSLGQLITSYPRQEVRKYLIEDAHITSILWPEVARRLYFRAQARAQLGNLPLALLAEHFDRVAARRLNADLDLIVGWSSFTEHTLERARARGTMTILERGSSHIEYQREILLEEASLQGVRIPLPHPRVVQKELREYDTADYIAVPSEFARRTFIARGVKSDRLLTIPFGVDLEQFRPLPVSSDGTFRLIFVGAMTFRKGLQYLLQAWSNLRLSRAELILVGARAPETDSLFDRYEGTFRYTGPVPQTRLPEFYSHSSVFVLPSIEEGMAMVIPQAMACGLPIICTTNSGGEDLVGDGSEGYVIPIRDVPSLEDRILTLYRDAALRRDMGARAVRKVSVGFTWDDYGSRAHAAYRRILTSRLEPLEKPHVTP